ncbi:hypothetical protein OAH23_11120 [Verrucomicrobia bacterium]|nr:hypothetical protein [Verrucomicrobiota bacterium]
MNHFIRGITEHFLARLKSEQDNKTWLPLDCPPRVENDKAIQRSTLDSERALSAEILF